MLLSMLWRTHYPDGGSMTMCLFDVGYLPGNIWHHRFKEKVVGRLVFRVEFRPVKGRGYYNTSSIGRGLHIKNIWKMLTNDTEQQVKIHINSVRIIKGGKD